MESRLNTIKNIEFIVLKWENKNEKKELKIYKRRSSIFRLNKSYLITKRILQSLSPLLKLPLFIGSFIGFLRLRIWQLPHFGATTKKILVPAQKHGYSKFSANWRCNGFDLHCSAKPLSNFSLLWKKMLVAASNLWLKVLLILLLCYSAQKSHCSTETLNFSAFCQFLWSFLLVFNLYK